MNRLCLLIALSLSASSCAALSIGKSYETTSRSNLIVLNERYIDILNRQMKEKYAHASPRRRILFYGYANQREQEGGVRVQIPF
jgi:hypothetical protein